MSFQDIKIGHMFEHNGTTWVKQSTRTAVVHGTKRVFYFSKTEEITPNIKVEEGYYGS
jgi:hypothetical protein